MADLLAGAPFRSLLLLFQLLLIRFLIGVCGRQAVSFCDGSPVIYNDRNAAHGGYQSSSSIHIHTGPGLTAVAKHLPYYPCSPSPSHCRYAAYAAKSKPIKYLSSSLNTILTHIPRPFLPYRSPTPHMNAATAMSRGRVTRRRLPVIGAPGGGACPTCSPRRAAMFMPAVA